MKLTDRLAALETQAAQKRQARLAIHEAAGDQPLTAEQQADYDRLKVEIAGLDANIRQAKADIEEERNAPPVASAAGSPAGRVRDVRFRADEDRARGFGSHREFMTAVVTAAQEGDVDERLRPLALQRGQDGAPKNLGDGTTYLLPAAYTPRSLMAAAGSDEQGGYSDAYGGHLVGRTTLPGLLQRGFEGDPTVGRTQPIPMATPVVDMPARVDSNHTSSVSGGFTVSRKAETVAGASSRSEYEKVTLKAATMLGLAYATEEIITDSLISFLALIDAGFRDEFPSKMLDEKLFGLGGDQFIGAATANNGSRIAVTRDTSTRILGTDVIAMRSRCWGYGRAVWITNHDCFGEMMRLGAAAYDAQGGTPLAGAAALFIQSLREDRPDTLLGRPVFYSEHAQTLGTSGDILLADWSQYLEGLYQPLQSAESMHVRFVNHERAFKFWLRNAGAPWWRAALTPRRSSSTLSPFVVLS